MAVKFSDFKLVQFLSTFAVLSIFAQHASAEEPILSIYNVRQSDICGGPNFTRCKPIDFGQLQRDFISKFERQGYRKYPYKIKNGAIRFHKSTLGRKISDYAYGGASGRAAFIIVELQNRNAKHVTLVRRSSENSTLHVTKANSPGGRIATYYELGSLSAKEHPSFRLIVDSETWDFELR